VERVASSDNGFAVLAMMSKRSVSIHDGPAICGHWSLYAQGGDHFKIQIAHRERVAVDAKGPTHERLLQSLLSH
jgi:hypothetical protein